MLGKSVVAQSLKKWGKHADLVDSPVEIGNPTCIMSYNLGSKFEQCLTQNAM